MSGDATRSGRPGGAERGEGSAGAGHEGRPGRADGSSSPSSYGPDATLAPAGLNRPGVSPVHSPGLRALSAFAAGSLFAVGLIVGGMTQPSKVFGFLDFTGNWDPSLTLVMGGALLVYGLTWRRVVARPAPLVDAWFLVPKRTEIDVRLVGGAALFGAGWAIAGFCPGPALVAVGGAMTQALIFVPAMAAGMLLARLLRPK